MCKHPNGAGWRAFGGRGRHRRASARASTPASDAPIEFRLPLIRRHSSSSGKARVRLVHAASDAGQIDVLAEGSNDELFNAVDFQAVSRYNDVDPWKGRLVVRADGETVNLLTVPGVQLDAGKVYTVVLSGSCAAYRSSRRS
jgi:hypothetical protein